MPSSRFLPVDIHGCRPVRVWPDTQDGLVFTATHSVSVGTATAVTVLLSVPTDEDYLFRPHLDASGAATWTFSEAPNASGGTAITAHNTDREDTDTLRITLTHTATYVSAGTILETHTAAAGVSGTTPAWYELAPSTLYLLRAVAAGAGTTVNITTMFVEKVGG